MTAVRSEILNALKTRLESITQTAGYDVTIKTVYHDKIPVGLELAPEDLPVLFLLDDGSTPEHEHEVVKIALNIRIQIVDVEEASDARIHDLHRAIGKAVWANHPVLQTNSNFRFHPKVVQIEMGVDETDLNMIEGNRIATSRMIVHYRTKPYDL